MGEGLSREERTFAEDREAAWRNSKRDMELQYSISTEPGEVVVKARDYIAKNESSTDPVIQGRVSGYEDFVHEVENGELK